MSKFYLTSYKIKSNPKYAHIIHSIDSATRGRRGSVSSEKGKPVIPQSYPGKSTGYNTPKKSDEKHVSKFGVGSKLLNQLLIMLVDDPEIQVEDFHYDE